MEPRVVILIASHIKVQNRVKTLQYALKSIQNNTRHPDIVYISYSCEDNLNIDENKWSQELTGIKHKFIKQPSQVYQFEHFKKLCEYVNDDDIIMFLDDDDLYYPEKLKLVINL